MVSPDLQKSSGVGRYTIEIARALAKEDEVSVFCNRCDTNLPDSVNIVKVPALKRPLFLRLVSFSFFAWVKVRRQKFDIVQSESEIFFNRDIIIAHSSFLHHIKAKYGTNWQSVFHGRNLIDFLKPGHLYSWAMATFRYRLRKYRKIIAVSELVKKQLKDVYRLTDKDISVVPNGLNFEEFSSGRDCSEEVKRQIRQTHRLKEDDLVLLFVGHDFKRKGLDFLVRALAFLPANVKLLVVGCGYWPHRKDFYIRLVQEENLSGRIFFVGTAKNVSDYYAAGDIFILPSLDEPFPLSVLEAMVCELPVIISRMTGTAEYLTNKKDCLIVEDVTNPEEIAEKIRYFLDKEIRTRIAIQGQRKVREFSWGKAAEQLTETYFSCLRKTNEK